LAKAEAGGEKKWCQCGIPKQKKTSSAMEYSGGEEAKRKLNIRRRLEAAEGSADSGARLEGRFGSRKRGLLLRAGKGTGEKSRLSQEGAREKESVTLVVAGAFLY